MNVQGVIKWVLAGLFLLVVTIGSAGARDMAVTNLEGYGEGSVLGIENVNSVGFVSVTYKGNLRFPLD